MQKPTKTTHPNQGNTPLIDGVMSFLDQVAKSKEPIAKKDIEVNPELGRQKGRAKANYPSKSKPHQSKAMAPYATSRTTVSLEGGDPLKISIAPEFLAKKNPEKAIDLNLNNQPGTTLLSYYNNQRKLKVQVSYYNKKSKKLCNQLHLEYKKLKGVPELVQKCFESIQTLPEGSKKSQLEKRFQQQYGDLHEFCQLSKTRDKISNAPKKIQPLGLAIHPGTNTKALLAKLLLKKSTSSKQSFIKNLLVSSSLKLTARKLELANWRLARINVLEKELDQSLSHYCRNAYSYEKNLKQTLGKLTKSQSQEKDPTQKSFFSKVRDDFGKKRRSALEKRVEKLETTKPFKKYQEIKASPKQFQAYLSYRHTSEDLQKIFRFNHKQSSEQVRSR